DLGGVVEDRRELLGEAFDLAFGQRETRQARHVLHVATRDTGGGTRRVTHAAEFTEQPGRVLRREEGVAWKGTCSCPTDGSSRPTVSCRTTPSSSTST